MALYVNGTTIAQSGAAVGGIEQVAVLPAVGATDHIYFLTVADATHPVGLYYFDGTVWHSTGSGSGSGTDDYNDLNNKPRVNGIELQGNKSLPMLDIAQASLTYTKLQVDELISASQKVYLQSTPPTAVSNVGLYYVGNVGDTNYAMWLVDSNKVVTNLGSAGISLDGYQKEQDFGLDTTVKTVVGGINELKYRLDNLPSGGTITMNGVVTGSPTFYAPTDSGTFGQKLISYGPYQAPQWVNESGDAGTKLHLNGSATVVPETYIYAPTNSGAAGYVLKSQGEGLAPQWVAPSAADSPTMTLNGTVKEVSASAVNIYAPLASGQDGYILKSKGPGLSPVWEAPGAADGAYMTLNDEEIAVTVDKAKVYSPTSAGTSGQILKSNGTSNAPTWIDAPSDKVTFNGSETTVDTSLSLYAPTTAGTKDQVLTSNGADKAPTWQVFSGIPTGVIMPFAGVTIPNGWLKCDGAAVKRSDYADLFDTIGTIYGDGDKVTTFNLPNLTSRFIEGGNTSTGTYKAAGLPNHNHTFTGTETQTGKWNSTYARYDADGSHSHSWTQNVTNKSGTDTKTVLSSSENRGSTTMSTGTTGSNHKHYFTAAGTIDYASSHNALYGKSTTVQPASLVMMYIIKY